MLSDKPNNDIIEISIFGTGGGYGESIVIHLPGGKWVIVDSCIDPKTGFNIPLSYLNSLDVDLNNVEYILATHWHNDHILGISDIFNQCKKSKIVFARALDQQKFAKLISLDVKKSKDSQSTSEFYKCINIAKARNFNFKEAIADRLIYQYQYNGKTIELITLSPSDYANHLFDQEIGELISKFGAANKRLIYTSPNFRSIVLLIKAGNHRALLGADLEVGKDNKIGWKHILSSTSSVDKPATLFKIPHHGSENGYCDEIWSKLLSQITKAGITPWNRNNKLPNSEMLEKYYKLSESLHITSPNIDLRKKKKSKEIERLLNQFQIKVKEIKYSFGHIRYRANINDNLLWEVDLAGEAFQINDL